MGFIINPYWFVSSTPPGDDYENYYSNDFDGTNDYVNIGDVLDQDGTSAFSMSFWVNLDTLAGHMAGKMLDSGTYAGYAAYINGNKLRFAIINSWSGNALAVDTVDDFATGSWKHVVVTYDGGQDVSDVKIYINGSSQTLTTIHNTLSSSSTTTAPFTIGARNGGALYLNGKTDEVAFFDSELSASDVTAIYNSGSPDSLASQSNLKGWWRMGDGANYPIVKNQAHFSQTAVDFDGSNDAVFITDSGVVPTDFQGMGNSSNYSFSCWIKTGTSAGAGTYWYCPATIVELRTETSSGTKVPFSFGIGSNKLWLGRTSNHLSTDEGEYSTDLIVSGAATWKHVAFTMNGDDYVFYINGSASGSGSFTTATGDCSVGTTTSNFVIGSRTTNTGTLSSAFNGEIDDCSFYNTTLSASDITDIYNSGHPKDESERSGLLTYYKFDGDTYPVVRDAMQFSNASLVFDGSDDYVDLGTGFNSSLELGDSFSISVWVKFGNTSTDRTIISNFNSSVTGVQLRILTSEKARFVIAYNGNPWKLVDTSILAIDTWHHIVATYDGSNSLSGMNIYVNGSLDNDSTSEGGALTTITSADSLKIGKYTGGQFYAGNIDDVSIYNTTLSASDITDIYNSGKPKDESSTSNVIGYWRMGDNTISPNVPSALGYGTHSVEFDGTNDYVTMGDVSSLDFSNSDAFSISAWVKLATVSSTHKMIVSKMDETADYRGYNIRSYNGAVKVSLSNDAGTNELQFTSTANPLTTAWHHVVFTYDGSSASSGCTVYVDGSAEAGSWTGTLSATISNSAPFNIGSRNNGSLPFNGKIKQVGIFNAELSASDVTSIYNSGLPKDISSESGLVSYYRMGDGEDKYPNILDYKGTAHGTMTNMASDDITTDNVGSGTMTNMTSDDIVADTPAGTSGQMTNMASDDFVAAKGAGTMTNMTAEDIVADVPS